MFLLIRCVVISKFWGSKGANKYGFARAKVQIASDFFSSAYGASKIYYVHAQLMEFSAHVKHCGHNIVQKLKITKQSFKYLCEPRCN